MYFLLLTIQIISSIIKEYQILLPRKENELNLHFKDNCSLKYF